MGKQVVKIDEYTCDTCGDRFYRDTKVDGPPVGISIKWFEVHAGGEGGEIWACSEACALTAFKNRGER